MKRRRAVEARDYLFTGKVNSPDHVAALRWFTKAAENGQVEAQFELGRIYRDGLGTRVDGKLAAYWLERAAETARPTRSTLLVSYTLDTKMFRKILPSQEAGSCAARR
jgi:TPR repeat protein